MGVALRAWRLGQEPAGVGAYGPDADSRDRDRDGARCGEVGPAALAFARVFGHRERGVHEGHAVVDVAELAVLDGAWLVDIGRGQAHTYRNYTICIKSTNS